MSREEDVVCPSCGNAVPGRLKALRRCPYCGARLLARLSMKGIILLVVALVAVSGLFTLVAVQYSEAPLYRASEIGEAIDSMLIKIEGVVVGPNGRYSTPFYYSNTSGPYISFYVDDGTFNEKYQTDRFRVIVYSYVAYQLLELGKVPGFMDNVTVVGVLNIRDYDPDPEDRLTIILRDPKDLTISRKAPIELSIEELLANPERYKGTRVKVRGKVEYIDFFGPVPEQAESGGNVIFNVVDGAKIEVFIPDDVHKATDVQGLLLTLTEGTEIEVSGVLWKYKQYWEIIPQNISLESSVDPSLGPDLKVVS